MKRTPEFGQFDTNDLADWMLRQHKTMCQWIREKAEELPFLLDGGLGLDEIDEAAVETAELHAYMAMLTLVVQYAIYEDIADGEDPMRMLTTGARKRAEFMLNRHAKLLPIPSDLKPRTRKHLVNVLAGWLVGSSLRVLVVGFDAAPGGKAVLKQMPKAIRRLWQTHEYKDKPLCQFMILAYYLAFKAFVGTDDEDAWRAMNQALWFGWSNRHLDIWGVMRDEELTELPDPGIIPV